MPEPSVVCDPGYVQRVSHSGAGDAPEQPADNRKPRLPAAVRVAHRVPQAAPADPVYHDDM